MQEGTSFSHKSLIKPLILATAMLFVSFGAWAQTRTSGAIAGVVQDPSGAVVPGATITATEVNMGTVHTTKTTGSGNYVFGDLNPGSYKVKVEASGFQNSALGPFQVPVSVTVTINVTLTVGQATQTVTVTEAAPVIEVQNPNTTTTLTAGQIANLPNPGQDLTYMANVSPGAVMNTGGGYGNTEFNGLPAVSNNFSQDGIPANDPFLNLNNSGATNLQLGLNSESEVAVNTNSFDTSQGGLGAMQMEYVSKKGGNQFHGNLYEIWNGASMNAADYFVNATPGATKPGSNVNEYGGSIGGPIKKDKAFFFTDIEGIRIALPVISQTTVPSSAYQNYILTQALPTGGVDPTLGINLPAQPAEIPFYKQMFGVYGTPKGTPIPEQFCPLGAGAPGNGNGCALHGVASTGALTHDFLWTTRVDQNLNDMNQIWYRFQYEKGFQATYNDPFNPALSAVSTQPQTSASIGYTHTFGPNLVNEFDPGYQWYSALFGPASPSKAASVFPETLDGTFGAVLPANLGGFTSTGGSDFIWPQGRNVTQYFVDDNLSWTKGMNEFKFGEQFHRFLISTHDFGVFNTPLVIQFNLPEYTYGAAAVTQQAFAKSLDEPIGAAGIDMYAQDAIKVKPQLTITLGVRATWNSNFTNQQGLFAQLAGPSFYQTDHTLTNPVKQALAENLSQGFGGTPLLMWQPRGAIAWQFSKDTVFRAGFGVFTDIFPGTVSDTLAQNPPYYNLFAAGLVGSVGGVGIAPGVAGSAIGAAVAANQSFASNLASGGLSCNAPGAPAATCVPAVSATAFPRYVTYPYSMQWNAEVEHQFGPSWGLDVSYVGTRYVQEPYYQQADAYQTSCQGCFAPFPYNAAPDARFGGVNQLQIGANSSYNALQVTARKVMSHGISTQIDYTWSHCLDTLSNGGLFGFSTVATTVPLPNELNRDYGNCDYDIRHALNANYVWQVPSLVHSGFLRYVTNGWQVSGDLYLHSGFPFTVFGSNPGTIVNTNGSNFGPIFANSLATNSQGNYAHDPIAGVTQAGQVQYLNPYAFQSVFDTSTGTCVGGNSPATCQFGNIARNSVFGPSFFWTDMFVSKYFNLSEKAKLRIDVQFYNLLNHPNFGFPGTTAGVPGDPSTLTSMGTITGTVSPPTGLLGSSLGGDSAVRMIAFQARIEF
ncbi:MAG TPA: carboxypeptidase-like regulatory domain-containing protein [Terriglobia bacterium]|nr:carboxypeptidase-like regulatory domain-containing protein [Terriglobia bacterium]